MAEATILPVVSSIIQKLTLIYQSRTIKSWSAGDYETMVELVQDIGRFLVHKQGQILKENSPRPPQLTVPSLLRPFPSLLSKLGLKDTESKKMGNVNIKLWLQDTKRRLNDIDDLLDVLPLLASSGISRHTRLSGSNPVCWPPNMPHIRHELEKIVKECRKLGLTGDVLEAWTVPTAHRLVEECENVQPEIVGRDKEKMEIISKLLALGNVGGPSVLAVFGVGGIGKTALAKLVYEDADDYHFDIKLWVSDSVKSDVSISRVLRGIIESATGEIALLTASILKDENTESGRTDYQHISVVSSYVNEATFTTLKRCNELRTLLFIPNYGPILNQLPSDLFLALPCMETLDLSGSHITELPSSIGNLTELRYFDLSFTLIERLPETIDRLVKLKTLKLTGCNKLYTLPKGMKKLICLRHLYFDVLGQLSFMPRGIGALTELRTLSAFIVDAEQGCSIRELRNLNNLTGSCCISGLENVSANDVSLVLKDKKHLTQIILRWDGYGATDEGNVSVPVWYLEPHCCLENLELFGYPKLRLPDWICDQKFKNLTSITFIKCENKRLNITLGSLPNLNYLGIIQMNSVITIDRGIHAGVGHVSFPKLKKLTIEGMLNLASWTAEAAWDDFPLLAEVSVKYCPKICELPFLAVLRSLESLEICHCTALESLSDAMLSEKLKTLVIDSCELLTTKYCRDGEHWHKIGHVPEIWFDLENIHSPSEDGHSNSSVSEDAE